MNLMTYNRIIEHSHSNEVLSSCLVTLLQNMVELAQTHTEPETHRFGQYLANNLNFDLNGFPIFEMLR
jgi:hypothetical protein